MPRKEKIALAITKGAWGGAGKYVYDIATRLKEKSYDVFVIAGEDGELSRRLRADGVRVVTIPEFRRDAKIAKELLAFGKLVYILWKEKPSVIHANSSKMGLFATIAGRATFVPRIIFTAHGWTHAEDRPFFEKTIIKFLHKITVALSHKTIAVSLIVRNQLGGILALKKIDVIYNGIGTHAIKSEKESREFLYRAMRTTTDAHRVWIGTIAELHKNKGLVYALRALNDIPDDVCLCIIGEGEERARLLKEAEILGVAHRVFFTGHIENAYLYVKAFDIFLLHSTKEGFPYAILEAGFARVPVIATGIGGIPEIITDFVNGILIQPKKPKEIAAAVSFILKNKKKAKEMARALEQKISREFTIEEMLEK